MKRVLTAAVLIPLVLVLVFLGPRWQWLFTLAVAAVAVLAGWEFLGLSGRMRGANLRALRDDGRCWRLFAVNFQWPDQTPALFGMLSASACWSIALSSSRLSETMADATSSIFCLLLHRDLR